MKFSELYEKVHNLPDFCRIYHEKVAHLKSDAHYSTAFTVTYFYQIYIFDNVLLREMLLDETLSNMIDRRT